MLTLWVVKTITYDYTGQTITLFISQDIQVLFLIKIIKMLSLKLT